VPPQHIDGIRRSPFWAGVEAIAPTLAYDHSAIMGKDASVPASRAARVRVPALAMYGTASPAFMHDTARTLSRAMPAAELRALDGQKHEVNPAVLAPVLAQFLA